MHPGVVSIRVEREINARNESYGRRFPFSDDFFERWFGFRPPESDEDEEKDEMPKFRIRGAGAGFIITADGYLISNHHVVDGATKVFVKFKGSKKEFKAKIIGTDPDTDIALLKIEGKNHRYLTFADSEKLNVGDIVMAIGNPFGFASTFTAGVVSATGRFDLLGGPRYQNFIQTDVAINPGNSGGPLLNVDGKVVGVNSMIYSQSGGNMGIGFAIPSKLVMKIIEQLKTSGTITRGWLGVGIQDLDAEMKEDLDLKADGVYIPQVMPDGPADKAGILAGDIILRYDKVKIDSSRQLMNEVAKTKPDTTVDVEVRRNKKNKIIKVKVGEKKSEAIARSESKKQTSELGIQVKAYKDDEGVRGVEIVKIEKHSPLREKNVREGDVIAMINYQNVQSVKEFNAMVASFQEGEKVLLHIRRDGYLRPLAVVIGKPKP